MTAHTLNGQWVWQPTDAGFPGRNATGLAIVQMALGKARSHEQAGPDYCSKTSKWCFTFMTVVWVTAGLGV